jgi:hypothetical protein
VDGGASRMRFWEWDTCPSSECVCVCIAPFQTTRRTFHPIPNQPNSNRFGWTQHSNTYVQSNTHFTVSDSPFSTPRHCRIAHTMGREGTTTRWVRFLRGLFSLWACSSRCRPFYLVSGCTSGASLPDETSARHLVSPHHTSYPPHQPACPTEPLHASEVDATTVRVQAWTDRNGHRNLQTAAPIPIPVYVTYISPPNTTPFNPVEQRYFEIAVNLLNRDFQSTPFVFRLERFHAVDAPQWRACPFASPSTAAMTQALHQGGTDALNVYVCRPAAFSGWSTLPQWLDLDFWDRRQDGIVLAEQAVVGVGNPSWRNTLTHEVGHWLGLFHTFENGCRAPGDGGT